MAVPTITTTVAFVKAIHASGILDAGQVKELVSFQERFNDPKALARELIQRGWLTPYQINQIFQGRGKELILGQYILLERLGEGGMGAVFKAKHRRLKRIDAIKVIRKDLMANANAVQRFHQEAEAAARVTHPNIVAVHDANESDGMHFLSMEFVEGIDLAKMVKQNGPLPIEQACAYVRQAAQGLQHAHERGLVHRDIKPSNLFVNVKEATVKVLDMGLARLRSSAADGGELTQSGTVMGTPDYISPEQAMDSRQVDIRADIYSLGCSLYFLLTGKPPFPGGDIMQKLLKHQLEQPQPMEQLRPEVPQSLAAVVRKMMDKLPEHRYQTPAEVAQAMGPFASGEATKLPAAVPMTEEELIRMGLWRQVSWYRRARAVLWIMLKTKWGRIATGAGAGAFLTLFLLVVILLKFSGGGKNDNGDDVVDNRPPLERLSADKIPPEEKFAWQPKDIVAIIGQHRWRQGRAVRGVAISPDKKIVASCGDDGLIRIWDSETGVEKAHFHHGGVQSLAFSPDGETLISGGTDGWIRVWDAAKLKEKKDSDDKPIRFQGHNNGIWAVAFSPDGNLVASGGYETMKNNKKEDINVGVVKLWDTTNWERQSFLRGDQNALVRSVAFSGDSKLVSGGRFIWDVDTGKMVNEDRSLYGRDNRSPIAVAFHGRKAAVAYDNGWIKYWNGAYYHAVPNEGEVPIQALAFAPNGTLASGDDSGNIRLWKHNSSDPPGTITNQGRLGSPISSLMFTSDGGTLVSGCYDTSIRLWDVADPQERPRSLVGTRYALSGFSLDGNTLYLRSGNDLIFWDLAAMKERKRFKGEGKGSFYTLRFPEGKPVAVYNSGGGVFKLWNVEEEKELATIKQDSPPVAVAAFSADCKTCVTAPVYPGDNKPLFKMKVWDVDSGEERTPDKTLEGSGGLLALAPDGKTVVWGWKLWNPGQDPLSLEPIGEFAYWSTAFTPNGQKFVISGRFKHPPHGFLRFYDRSGKILWDMREHQDGVSTFAFSPDNKRLATVCSDGKLVLWNAETGAKLYDYQTPGPIHNVAFAPDNRHLAIQNFESVIYIIRLPGGKK